MRALILVLALMACAPPMARADVDDLSEYTDRLAACIAAAQTPATLSACQGEASQPCMDADGHTTLGMMQCLDAEGQVWEQDAEASLARLRAERPDAASTLNESQTAWEAYVESACAYRVALWGEGSGARVELAACYAQLHAERAIALRRAVLVAD